MREKIAFIGKQISKRPIKLKCQRCGYTWVYNGISEWYATCPHCLTKVSIKKNKVRR